MFFGIDGLKSFEARKEDLNENAITCDCDRCLDDQPEQFYLDHQMQRELVGRLINSFNFTELYQAAKVELGQIKLMLGKYSREGSVIMGTMVVSALNRFNVTGTLIAPIEELVDLVREAQDVWRVVFGEFNPYYCESFKPINVLMLSVLFAISEHSAVE